MTRQDLDSVVPLGLWLMALVCFILQVVKWMRVRTATPDSLHDKYFIASGSHWLIAAIVLALVGVLVHVGTAPAARWMKGEQ